MAFVYKSERKTTFGHTKTTDLGPGQYIAQELDSRKGKRSSKAPFLTTTNRTFTSNLTKKEEIPGPGTYYPSDETNFFSTFNQTKSKKLNPIYKNLEYEQPTSFEKLGFSTKEKRFNFGDVIKSECPGPGQYEVHKLKPINEKKIIIDKDKKKSESQTKSHKTITIPSKNKCFGYDILPDGNAILANDPLKFIKYAGEKSDSVGPGAYELENNKNWLKKGTTWSKFKVKKSNFGDTKGSAEGRIRSSQSLLENENYIEKRKIEREKVFKHLKEKKEKRKKMVETFHNVKTEEIDKIIKLETPGPGYYESTTASSWRNNKIPETFQFFGSISERFPRKEADNDNTIGPGSYFRDDSKFRFLNKRQVVKPAFNSNSNRDTLQNTTTRAPGPGTYEPEKLKEKKFFSKNTIFNSNTKRFIEVDKDQVMVPVSYIKVDNDINSDLSYGSNRFKYSAPFKSPERKVEAFTGKGKDEVPPIGWYNSDYIYNLSYNIGKKIYRPTMVEVPFNSMKKRFIENKVETNLGPGQYFKEVNVKEKDQSLPPFRTNEKRFKNENKMETDIGPGLYNQSSFFDWNKKTYNVNFL